MKFWQKRTRVFFFIISTILLACVANFCLTGCVPMLVVAGTAACVTVGGTVLYDKRSTGTIFQDRAISSDIERAIKANYVFEKSRIVISSYDKVVLLVGQVSNEDLKKKVEDIASNTKGVRSVHNKIVIKNISAGYTNVDDSMITAKVKTALMREKGLRSSQIKIITENSIVYMMGIVSKDDGDIAAKRASEVGGVRKVVKLFECITSS